MMNKQNVYKKNIAIISAVFILLFCEWFFFRNILGTQNGELISDRADGRLTMLLTEHWWKFFTGKEKFSEIPIFYPQKEVFGYTDLFLGFGLIHSILRFFGLNMFIAYKWTIILVHLFGTMSMFYLLRKSLKCSNIWSLFGTIAFSFSDSYARHLGHTQLAALSALPVLLILFIGFISNFEKRKKRNIYGYGFITWFVLLTYNSWYVACFTGLYCLIFIVLYNVVLGVYNFDEFKKLWINIRNIWKDIITYVGYTVLLFIPFIKIYIPVMKSSSGYSYSLCKQYLPEFADIINVTEGNFMMGGIIKKLGLATRGYSGEETQGFSVVLLLLFAVGILCYRKKLAKLDENNKKTWTNILVKCLIVAIVICLVLPIRLSSNGVSFWMLVYVLLPVVRSMRAVARFWLWLSFPISVLTVYLVDKYIKMQRRTLYVISGACTIALFVSNINTVGVSNYWNYNDEMSFLSNVAEPPENAKVFYIIDSSDTSDPAYIYQVDAFEIATKYSLKTINGYSGQMPKGWEGIWDVKNPDYESKVAEWINKNNLKDVYVYDRATNIWESYEQRIKNSISETFSPSENVFSYCQGVQDRKQGEFIWTNQNFEVTIENNKIQSSGLVLKIGSYLSRYLQQDGTLEPYIRLYIDDVFVQEIPVDDNITNLKVPVQNHNSDIYKIRLETNCYFVPSDIGINDDSRQLSLAVYYIGN